MGKLSKVIPTGIELIQTGRGYTLKSEGPLPKSNPIVGEVFVVINSLSYWKTNIVDNILDTGNGFVKFSTKSGSVYLWEFEKTARDIEDEFEDYLNEEE